jgi:hypothetical protein
MPPPLIVPRKSLPERAVLWCRSWSPQVKQGAITAAVLVVLTALGWVVSRSGSKTPGQVIAATNVSGAIFIQGNGNQVAVGRPPEAPLPPSGLPTIVFETLPGLPLGIGPDPALRVHALSIRNTTGRDMEGFCGRLQLPEPITRMLSTNLPLGTRISCRPLLLDLLVQGTGGRSPGGLWLGATSAVHFEYPDECFLPKGGRGQQTQHSGAGEVTGIWEFQLDRLPREAKVSLQFLTSAAPIATNYIQFASTPLWSSPPNPSATPDTNELRFSFEGEYSLAGDTQARREHFLTPLLFQERSRTLSSLTVQRDLGHWHPVVLNLY